MLRFVAFGGRFPHGRSGDRLTVPEPAVDDSLAGLVRFVFDVAEHFEQRVDACPSVSGQRVLLRHLMPTCPCPDPQRLDGWAEEHPNRATGRTGSTAPTAERTAGSELLVETVPLELQVVHLRDEVDASLWWTTVRPARPLGACLGKKAQPMRATVSTGRACPGGCAQLTESAHLHRAARDDVLE